jgi:hypothetical protein
LITSRSILEAASHVYGGAVTHVCSRCGASDEGAEDGLPSGWSLETGRRGLERLCLDCTRRNIRSIEGKLPEEWWE